MTGPSEIAVAEALVRPAAIHTCGEVGSEGTQVRGISPGMVRVGPAALVWDELPRAASTEERPVHPLRSSRHQRGFTLQKLVAVVHIHHCLEDGRHLRRDEPKRLARLFACDFSDLVESTAAM